MKLEYAISFVAIFVLVTFGLLSFVEIAQNDAIRESENRITSIELQMDKHERIEKLEKFIRALCIDGRVKACALVGPVEK